MDRGIGEKVKELRQRLGLSQQEFALKIGYSSGAMISKVEAGQRVPHWDYLNKMTQIAGIGMDYFFPDHQPDTERPDQDSYLAFLKFQELVLKDQLPSLADYLRIRYHYSDKEVDKFLDLQKEIDEN